MFNPIERYNSPRHDLPMSARERDKLDAAGAEKRFHTAFATIKDESLRMVSCQAIVAATEASRLRKNA